MFHSFVWCIWWTHEACEDHPCLPAGAFYVKVSINAPGNIRLHISASVKERHTTLLPLPPSGSPWICGMGLLCFPTDCLDLAIHSAWFHTLIESGLGVTNWGFAIKIYELEKIILLPWGFFLIRPHLWELVFKICNR